ncbi:30S ribosomal protein S6 [Calycomorphotria hydatis]|uniref:Small ribosomal subunit protein bS6 n=1 Tax=Calycomorphotria hydatis TaxID=2528027 RepID=A0A517TCX7_9PLAN|nr:30S ribosomal protein S6 [Calycomorphotria hydatis]QDT66233.1 30S ribosomal protein S6 [Calycomorphotria hydatis]
MSEDNSNLGDYEGMFLLDSAKFASDPDGAVADLTGIIEKCEGEIVAHRPWQDGRLAYEIEGRRKGLHYLIMFRMPPTKMDEFDRACHLSDRVLRQMTIRHPDVLFEAMVASISPDAAAETEEEPVAAGADE